MLLYRYLDSAGGLATLKGSALKATRPVDFNDPFEYLLRVKVGRQLFRKEFLAQKGIQGVIEERISTRLKSLGIAKPRRAEKRSVEKEVVVKLRHEFDVSYARGEEESMHYRLDTLSKKMAVCCFSEEPNHPLMWSHYAEGHKGMLIKFDTALAFATEPNMIKISYTQEPPEFDYLDGDLPKNRSTQAAFEKKILGRKFSLWEYEKEHRVQFDLNILKRRLGVNNEEVLLFEIPRKSIRSVVIGCRFPSELLSELRKISSHPEFKELDLKRAKASTTNYELIYEPFE